MKKLTMLGLAATLVIIAQLQTQPAQSKSLRSMIDSAINATNGRNAYWDQFKYNNPYYGYGYGSYPYGYYGYPTNNPYYGYSPHYGRSWY